MIATDGLVVRQPPALPYGDGLGEWSISPLSDLLAIQPGLYFHTDAEGERVVRSRGFGKSDMSFDDAASLMPRGVTPDPLAVLFAYLPTTVRRFAGLGTTVRRGSWDAWRSWESIDSRVTLNPWPRRGLFECTPNGIETYAPATLPAATTGDVSEWRARTLESTANMDGT